MYLNADNLLNKREELEALVCLHAPDLISVTEIAPKISATPLQPAEIQLDSYNHMISLGGTNRGVAIYTHKKLKATPCPELNQQNFQEHCWLTVELQGRDRLLVGCIYRSPNSDPDNNDALISLIYNACSLKSTTHVLITGDFNLPDIEWTNSPTTTRGPDSLSAKFINCHNDCFLWQHVNFPTHQRANQTPNLLDLILTNEENMVNEVSTLSPLGKSHHSILSFRLICYAPKKSQNRRIHNLKRGNYDKLRTTVRNHLTTESDHQEVEQKWNHLYAAINVGIERSIPLIRSTENKKKPPWINETLLTKIREKQKAFKKYKLSGMENDYKYFCRLRNQTRWESRKAKKAHEKSLAREAKRNPKPVYKYINSRLKTKSDIPVLHTTQGRAIQDKDKAEALNNYFTSVFTDENPELPNQTTEVEDENCIPELTITEEVVLKKLKSLKPDKSPGPDGLHPKILKELAEVIYKPVTVLMQRSLETSILPSCWSSAHVTAIHKKGNKCDVQNYRPISLTCQLCKVMEAILRDHIITYLEDNNLLSIDQHGFIPKKSCATQLLECLEEWTQALDEGGNVDILYLDLCKAFDSVPHQRLLMKMKNIGIKGNLLEWTRAFLTRRKQCVVLNGDKSSWTEVISGVPQGSVIGPLLFVIYINDMPNCVSSCLKLFADDAKLFRRVATTEDHLRLELDLQNLHEWTKTWQMSFNASKCQVLHLGNTNPEHQYQLSNVCLSSDSAIRDLGVIVDKKLSFKQHIEAQVAKANRTLGIIRRSFTYLDKQTLVLLYKSLVRTHLEYCNTIIYPRTIGLMKEVERVQRRATKQQAELRDLPYEQRLEILQLPSMKYRFRRGDAIEMYKYLHHQYNTTPEKVNITLSESRTRGHPLKLKKPRCSTTLRMKTFPYRIIDEWNSLPEEVVMAPSLNAFKTQLDNYWRPFIYDYEP